MSVAHQPNEQTPQTDGSDMEMKPGYKQTEVGVIPKEWSDCDISDLCQLQRGFDLTEATRKRGEIPVYSSSGLAYFHNEARLQPPAVITGRKGMLGRVFYVEEPCWPHDTTLWVKDFKGNYPRFVALFLGQFRLERFDAATSVPTLNRNNVKGVPIKLPPLPEQHAIASALSDVDALLASLARFIAKKRDLKQAAMQQLLTGQTRLPGFSGEWGMMRLGDVAEIVMGQSPSSSNNNTQGDGIPLIQGNADVANRKTIIRVFTTQITKSGRTGDILMSVRAPVGEVSRATFDVCLGRGVCAVRYPNDFLYHCLIFLEPTWAKHSKGSTFDSVNSNDVKAVEIHLPTHLPEQTAIAAVLSEMDAELAALEQRHAKTRALKQGMMQELLTGRTRLLG